MDAPDKGLFGRLSGGDFEEAKGVVDHSLL
jgi:hypothetical protein